MLYKRAMFSNTARTQKSQTICWSIFRWSRAQFGSNVVCFSCRPKVPTKNSHHRITVVSLQSVNDFLRTFLDYTGNSYKHLSMALSSTIAEVLSICSCTSWMLCPVCNLVLWPQHDSCANGFGWGCCIHSPKEAYYLAPHSYCMLAAPGCWSLDRSLCQFY